MGGYGDHLRYCQDQVSCILARGRGRGMVEMGEGFKRLRGYDMDRVSGAVHE